MASSPPTILLLPGAFTTPACYDWLTPHLEKAGYPVVRAAQVTTNPKDPSACTAEQEGANLLNNYLQPLIDQGKDVVIFAHSFGATSCSGAKHDLVKASRQAKGLPGGVLGFIGFSFAFCRDGVSQLEYLGGNWPPFCKLDTPAPGLLVFDPAVDLLYNDIEPGLQSELVNGHLPQAIGSFAMPIREPLWTDPALEGRRLYVRSLKDNTFPLEAQNMFVENCGCDFEVVEIDAGHSAFISRAEEMAKIIVDAAKKWV